MTVQPLAYEVSGFKDYFLHLTPFNNLRNPWFVEFWEQHFRCKFPGSSWTPYNDNYKENCTGTERIKPEDFDMEAQLQFVSDATMVFAYALTVRSLDNVSNNEFCGPLSPNKYTSVFLAIFTKGDSFCDLFSGEQRASIMGSVFKGLNCFLNSSIPFRGYIKENC